MPIQRPLDFFTSMGPGDVLLAGHLQKRVSGLELYLQVTPEQCVCEEVFVGPNDVQYLVTLPGKGSLDIAGVCTAFQPDLPVAPFRHIVHSYDRDSRTIEFRILEEVPTVPPGPKEVPLEEGERLYFWVHLYDSSPQRPNLVIEAP